MSTAIPTNIIGGFLGSGKTTVIRHLLEHKPEHERWAILINEFGEIGIDAALLETPAKNIFIKEVTGGCMCCTAGLSMQIALNMLIAQAKPDRMLIEPTGLGHPLEIIANLSAPHYADIIRLNSCLGLIDAQQLQLARQYQPELFMQQLEAADILLASKSELYSFEHKRQLEQFLRENNLHNKPLQFIRQGQVSPELLSQASQPKANLPQVNKADAKHSLPSTPLPSSGFIRRQNHSDNTFSCGWIFSNEYIFSYQALRKFFAVDEWLRIKACFNTEKGMFGFNKCQQQTQELNIQPQTVSKLELISEQALDWAQIEQQLHQCIYTKF